MVNDDLYTTVPSLFRCPISLDVMKSPVSLCTGVTYDRSSIQRWLDAGNNTCPATMQELTTKDYVPNHTLQRLIQIWSNSVRTRSNSPHHDSKSNNTREQARQLIEIVERNLEGSDEVMVRCLTKLNSFAVESVENRRFLARIHGFVELLFEILMKRKENVNVCVLEKVVLLCGLILDEFDERDVLARFVLRRDFMASMLIILQRGSLASRSASARVLDYLAGDTEAKVFIAEYGDVLPELLRLVSSDSDSNSNSNSNSDLNSIETGLVCLIRISTPKRIRKRMISLGGVKLLGKTLSLSDLRSSIDEMILKLLEMASSSNEGRRAICDDEICVQAIVKKLLKISSTATEHAVTILWSLCCLFRDQKAQESVTKSNGLAKFLLLMQSNCSPAVRQMAGDLLKIFRVNSKCCLSSYETKTTHIMPF